MWTEFYASSSEDRLWVVPDIMPPSVGEVVYLLKKRYRVVDREVNLTAQHPHSPHERRPEVIYRIELEPAE